jgi:hypothetical protein
MYDDAHADGGTVLYNMDDLLEIPARNGTAVVLEGVAAGHERVSDISWCVLSATQRNRTLSCVFVLHTVKSYFFMHGELLPRRVFIRCTTKQ